ncbi:MAG: hypothetical protein OER21_13220 [Gemmatimonadota bacterium]|nr:hypothetical protein [Gemmatimonadota bacterium]
MPRLAQVPTAPSRSVPPGARRWADAGFALPTVLLLVVLLTALLTTGLTRAAADRQVAGASEATATATAVAWNGLQTYFNTVNLDACERPSRPVDGDSVRINVPGGYADIVARVVKRPVDSLANWLYVVRADGYVIQPATGPTPVARQTVAQYAEWQSGRLSLPGAFTATNGLTRISGGTGELRGADEHPTVSCQRPAKYALRVTASVPSLSGYNIYGLAPLGGGSGAAIVTAAGIDWAATLAPGGIVPDFTSVQPGDMTYPVVLVTGNATLGAPGATTTGTGLLIVSGDLTVLGTFVQWYGVVLVGGRIRFDADDQRFDGLVASGLNVQLGGTPPTGEIGGDYTDIDYNSLYVARAMRPLAGFTAVPNTYTNQWKAY